jgi:radical SAM protein with 4Fe4S-binding SPASM domain
MLTDTIPKHLWFEPTNTCNAKCPLCPTGADQLSRPKAFLDLDLYKRIIDEVRPETVRFWNYGEPFLHPQIFEMFRYAADHDAQTAVSTNGFVFYKPENISKLLHSGLHTLMLAIDGIDAETFNQYRIGVDYPKVIKGLGLLLQQRPFPLEVIWQFIIMRHNEHQIDAAQAIAQQLGIKFALKAVSLDMLPQQANPNEYLPNNSHYSRYTWQNEAIVLKGGQHSCYFVDATLMINADGSVTPCSFDAQGLLPLGNATTQSITEIWNGQPLKQLRYRLEQERQTLKPCQSCSVGSNLFL